ncbi:MULTISPECIES: hypothetical protein [Blastopirellula]|uniref:Uncharacterized protein n=1 Tax=Blastopirellula marina DSM 3645 TaxID=314230 RepID=A3ZPI7_9BACT|nr:MULTISPECIES: hypothetical protein [Blastopirellula]EAQ81665.1 hypothetical protein DSM3645_28827 [Blastopirellula marina DSM 3645]UUO04625.1 hypothetical protein M4951_14625 [Blastopirellula sp. J2-11]
MQGDPHFIEDGYTEQGYIAEAPNLYGALQFEFRPMLHQESDDAVAAMTRAPNSSTSVVAAALAQHLTKWSAKGPITADRLVKMRVKLLERLYGIVSGARVSDVPPEATHDEVQQTAARLHMAPGEAEARDLKNSETGSHSS